MYIFSLLDFNSPPLHFNVQSTTPLLPFWTSSVHSSTSTSNPPRNFFPFGLQLASPPLQRPIRHATSSLLDFLRVLLYFNVQSVAPFRSFWTFACLPSTSTSNPPRRFFPFGLPPCIPLLQHPIHHAASSLLDFLRVFHYFNIQSAAQLLPFWTSSVYSTTSTSNPPRSFFPFGLLRAFPPLQRPIRHSFSSLLDFLRAFLYFNVQFATQLLPFWTSACLPTASTSNSNLSAPQFLPLQIF